MTDILVDRDSLSATFSALSDPTRRAIIERLVDGEATVSELSEPFDMTLPAVSKHLKVLERAGLIERSRHAQRRPCRLAPQRLGEAAAWIETYRRLWDERFDRFGDYIDDLQAKLAKDRRRFDDQRARPAPGPDQEEGQ